MRDHLRLFLLFLFIVGVMGTGLELFLLGHTEDVWQWVPLVLLATSLVVLVISAVSNRARAIQTFRGVMVLMVASAAVGLWQHYTGNAEFELEIYPSRKGWELFWESLTGATPTLAPGMMLHLGFLGLAYTFRHPLLVSESTNAGKQDENTE